jgi:hypothetical protein
MADERHCASGVCDPRRVQGLLAGAVPGKHVAKGKHEVIEIEGPGVFLAAEISKQGGTGDLTFVGLEIDGRGLWNLSYAAATNFGLTAHNAWGQSVVSGFGIKTMVLGLPTPLRFQKHLVLTVQVNENGVDQIVANVLVGKAT